MIAEDWRLALPLIEKCLRGEAYDEALSLARQSADALPRSHGEPLWNPEADLLARQRNGIGYSERREAEQTKVCALWRDAAVAKGKASLAWELDLQHIALRKVSDGEVMLDAFAAATAPELVQVRERCYSEWHAEVVKRALEASRTKEPPRGCEWSPRSSTRRAMARRARPRCAQRWRNQSTRCRRRRRRSRGATASSLGGR